MMSGDFLLPPALVLLAGAVMLPVLPRSIRSAAFCFFPLLSLAIVLTVPDGSSLRLSFITYELLPLRVDQLSRVFGIIFCVIAFGGGLYAYHLRDTGQQVSALLYAAGSLGVTFSGDFLTLIVFWETMAVSSTYLIWANGNDSSRHAGMRYLIVHLFGGSLLLAGILLSMGESGSLLISSMTEGSASSWLILSGVALNAAIPPLNAWLPDAYPRATVTGAVFLSAFTTKTAVYVLARAFAGWEILLILGVIMTLYGVVYAVLSNDIRGILSYHIISQVGFMVAGVGIGTEMALNGSVAHAFSHILYKALLFMGTGAVLHATGSTKLTELGGLYASMRPAFWLYMVGAFSISGVPLFNGFISKSMVVSAADEAGIGWAYTLLHLASVGTFLSIALKLPAATWFGKGNAMSLSPLPKNMLLAMSLLAALCIAYGCMPSLLYSQLPYPVQYEPFTIAHVIEAVQMLALTFVAFRLLQPMMKTTPTTTLDTDWFYRKPARLLRRSVVDGIGKVFDWAEAQAQKSAITLSMLANNPGRLWGSEGEYNPDADRRPLGILIAAVLLCCVVLAAASVMWLR